MRGKAGPYILIAMLLVILMFILGVRYGQRVEKTNKMIDYLISLPPSATLQPTQIPLNFKEYSHKGCGIKFLYPSSLEKTEESSLSAKLSSISSLTFDCSNGNKIADLLQNEKMATAELTFKSKLIEGKIKPDPRMVVGAEPWFVFKIIHPRTAKNIFIELSKSLYPLFEKTLEYN